MKATIDDKQWQVFLDRLKNYGEPRGVGGGESGVQRLLRAAFSVFGFKDVIDHFRKEEGPNGKWKPRAQSTQEMYAAIASGRRKPPSGSKKGSFSPSNKLLQLTGTMRMSLLPGNLKRVGRERLLFFANDEKSAIHDEGSTRKRIPKREFMWLSSRAQDLMAKFIVEKWSGL